MEKAIWITTQKREGRWTAKASMNLDSVAGVITAPGRTELEALMNLCSSLVARLSITAFDAWAREVAKEP